MHLDYLECRTLENSQQNNFLTIWCESRLGSSNCGWCDAASPWGLPLVQDTPHHWRSRVVRWSLLSSSAIHLSRWNRGYGTGAESIVLQTIRFDGTATSKYHHYTRTGVDCEHGNRFAYQSTQLASANMDACQAWVCCNPACLSCILLSVNGSATGRDL